MSTLRPLQQSPSHSRPSSLSLTHKTPTRNPNIDVQLPPNIVTSHQQRLKNFLPRNSGLQDLQRNVVNPHPPLTRLNRSPRDRRLPLPTSQQNLGRTHFISLTHRTPTNLPSEISDTNIWALQFPNVSIPNGL